MSNKSHKSGRKCVSLLNGDSGPINYVTLLDGALGTICFVKPSSQEYQAMKIVFGPEFRNRRKCQAFVNHFRVFEQKDLFVNRTIYCKKENVIVTIKQKDFSLFDTPLQYLSTTFVRSFSAPRLTNVTGLLIIHMMT